MTKSSWRSWSARRGPIPGLDGAVGGHAGDPAGRRCRRRCFGGGMFADFGPPGLMQGPSMTNWLEDFSQTRLGLMVVVLPGQLVFLGGGRRSRLAVAPVAAGPAQPAARRTAVLELARPDARHADHRRALVPSAVADGRRDERSTEAGGSDDASPRPRFSRRPDRDRRGGARHRGRAAVPRVSAEPPAAPLAAVAGGGSQCR